MTDGATGTSDCTGPGRSTHVGHSLWRETLIVDHHRIVDLQGPPGPRTTRVRDGPPTSDTRCGVRPSSWTTTGSWTSRGHRDLGLHGSGTVHPRRTLAVASDPHRGPPPDRGPPGATGTSDYTGPGRSTHVGHSLWRQTLIVDHHRIVDLQGPPGPRTTRVRDGPPTSDTRCGVRPSSWTTTGSWTSRGHRDLGLHGSGTVHPRRTLAVASDPHRGPPPDRGPPGATGTSDYTGPGRSTHVGHSLWRQTLIVDHHRIVDLQGPPGPRTTRVRDGPPTSDTRCGVRPSSWTTTGSWTSRGHRDLGLHGSGTVHPRRTLAVASDPHRGPPPDRGPPGATGTSDYTGPGRSTHVGHSLWRQTRGHHRIVDAPGATDLGLHGSGTVHPRRTLAVRSQTLVDHHQIVDLQGPPDLGLHGVRGRSTHVGHSLWRQTLIVDHHRIVDLPGPPGPRTTRVRDGPPTSDTRCGVRPSIVDHHRIVDLQGPPGPRTTRVRDGPPTSDTRCGVKTLIVDHQPDRGLQGPPGPRTTRVRDGPPTSDTRCGVRPSSVDHHRIVDLQGPPGPRTTRVRDGPPTSDTRCGVRPSSWTTTGSWTSRGHRDLGLHGSGTVHPRRTLAVASDPHRGPPPDRGPPGATGTSDYTGPGRSTHVGHSLWRQTLIVDHHRIVDLQGPPGPRTTRVRDGPPTSDTRCGVRPSSWTTTGSWTSRGHRDLGLHGSGTVHPRRTLAVASDPHRGPPPDRGPPGATGTSDYTGPGRSTHVGHSAVASDPHRGPPPDRGPPGATGTSDYTGPGRSTHVGHSLWRQTLIVDHHRIVDSRGHRDLGLHGSGTVHPRRTLAVASDLIVDHHRSWTSRGHRDLGLHGSGTVHPRRTLAVASDPHRGPPPDRGPPGATGTSDYTGPGRSTHVGHSLWRQTLIVDHHRIVDLQGPPGPRTTRVRDGPPTSDTRCGVRPSSWTTTRSWTSRGHRDLGLHGSGTVHPRRTLAVASDPHRGPPPDRGPPGATGTSDYTGPGRSTHVGHSLWRQTLIVDHHRIVDLQGPPGPRTTRVRDGPPTSDTRCGVRPSSWTTTDRGPPGATGTSDYTGPGRSTHVGHSLWRQTLIVDHHRIVDLQGPPGPRTTRVRDGPPTSDTRCGVRPLVDHHQIVDLQGPPGPRTTRVREGPPTGHRDLELHGSGKVHPRRTLAVASDANRGPPGATGTSNYTRPGRSTHVGHSLWRQTLIVDLQGPPDLELHGSGKVHPRRTLAVASDANRGPPGATGTSNYTGPGRSTHVGHSLWRQTLIVDLQGPPGPRTTRVREGPPTSDTRCGVRR
ncbi:hypothetical protein CRUP_016747 [Coryphaenoides rupestris]|nr:hypothetical protein CRUP_016747 [Coryphaenoides rupestris]